MDTKLMLTIIAVFSGIAIGFMYAMKHIGTLCGM